MTQINPKKWLLLIHQIPPKPNALRVKIWRRLQQVGAISIKQSVYAMPLTEQSREDLSWILKEIINNGGDGSISEVQFKEGLNSEQVVSLFQTARDVDYGKIIEDASLLLTSWSSGENDPHDPAVKGPAKLSRLQHRLNTITAIDFFQAPAREAANILLDKLKAHLSSHSSEQTVAHKDNLNTLKGKTWVTRKNPFIDRIACGWLIQRFIDKGAVFKFVDTASYTPAAHEIRFDMFEGEYTHEGDLCTFEVMIQRFKLKNPAITSLAEVVHDIDLKDNKYDHTETNGFNALVTGLNDTQPNDNQRLTEGFRLFDNLYAYFQRQK